MYIPLDERAPEYVEVAFVERPRQCEDYGACESQAEEQVEVLRGVESSTRFEEEQLHYRAKGAANH